MHNFDTADKITRTADSGGLTPSNLTAQCWERGGIPISSPPRECTATAMLGDFQLYSIDQQLPTEPQIATERSGKVLDYKPVQTAKSSFSLGMDYEEKADTRTPSEKLQDFVHAGAARATDQAGWKDWMQGEIDKFRGIGSGLNEAKNETKTAVATAWKALTNGTVTNFLAQPNAVNAPMFSSIAGAFDAMGKDPEVTNKAVTVLGTMIMNANEEYSKLPHYQQGEVIGKFMFGMFNPEGSTEAGEAALNVADRLAMRVDSAVAETIDNTIKSTEGMNSDLAQSTKKMLYNYIKSKGLSASELENGGYVPKNFFDSLSGKGGDWAVLNERPSPDVLQQLHSKSCVAACGEMLTEGAVKQEHLIEQLLLYHPEELREKEMPAALEWVARELGPQWKGGAVKLANEQATISQKLDAMLSLKRPWCTALYEGGPIGHAVIVEGVDEVGHISIKDPFHATRYEMTREEFLTFWTQRVVFFKGE